MENTLHAYARQWQQVDTTDPVQIAALELLGQAQNWEVKKIRLIKFFQLNPENMLNDREFLYSQKLLDFRAKPISERLAIVADIYLPR